MSDPDRTGPYTCCQPMLALELPDIASGDCVAICEHCGIYRHLLPTRFVTLRARVDAAMPAILEAYLVGARGDVQ